MVHFIIFAKYFIQKWFILYEKFGSFMANLRGAGAAAVVWAVWFDVSDIFTIQYIYIHIYTRKIIRVKAHFRVLPNIIEKIKKYFIAL